MPNHPATVRAVQQPVEARRGAVEQGKNVQAQVFQVYGRVDISGAGEATFDANFPVWFQEAPQISFSGELTGNQILTAGQYPTISVMVRRWTQKRRAGAMYYVGAQFIVVIDGPTETTAIAHWQCEGVGLTNPLIDSDLGDF